MRLFANSYRTKSKPMSAENAFYFIESKNLFFQITFVNLSSEIKSMIKLLFLWFADYKIGSFLQLSFLLKYFHNKLFSHIVNCRKMIKVLDAN